MYILVFTVRYSKGKEWENNLKLRCFFSPKFHSRDCKDRDDTQNISSEVSFTYSGQQFTKGYSWVWKWNKNVLLISLIYLAVYTEYTQSLSDIERRSEGEMASWNLPERQWDLNSSWGHMNYARHCHISECWCSTALCPVVTLTWIPERS